jgi:hypothetical protein
MVEYRRPAVPTTMYRDEAGRQLDYGHRWDEGSPPNDVYSTVTNPQRYAPLHTVARALIDWVQNTYDVAVVDEPAARADFMHSPGDDADVIRVTPRHPFAAPLTFALTSFPGLYVHAGLLHDFYFPACGCDACDDDVGHLLDDVESLVRTVVAGGYRERAGLGPADTVEFHLEGSDGANQSGRQSVHELPEERATAALLSLPEDGQWQPWPVRGDIRTGKRAL